jgi:hypothetical protein
MNLLQRFDFERFLIALGLHGVLAKCGGAAAQGPIIA